MSHAIDRLSSRGGPYASSTAALGGLASNIPDTPIDAIFIFIYLCFATANLVIFRRNQARNHKFILSILLVGFSFARVTTLILCIAWANRQHNVQIATAANIFVNAGVCCVCMLLAGFKAGATWSPPRSQRDPAWYDSKACFYVFNFTLEVLILSLLTFSRIDQRFFVVDGCRVPGDYTRRRGPEGPEGRDIESSATSHVGEGDQGVPKVG